MDTWEYIRICVHSKKNLHNLGEKRRCVINHGPQILPIRKNRTDKQSDAHAAEQVQAASLEILLCTLKQQDKYRTCYIKKPEQIWNDEILTKRNVVIQCTVNHRIVGHMFLQPEKPRKINKNVTKRPSVGITLKK